MLQPPPARPGMHEDDVDTPALLIDLDALDIISIIWPGSWRRPAPDCGHMQRPTNRP